MVYICVLLGYNENNKRLSDKVVDKIKFHTLCSIDLLRKLWCLLDNIEKYGTAGQATTSSIIQGIHKRMVRFQKLTRNLFLALHGHNIHRQQLQLSKFLMRYQQFASRAYCGASFQDGVAAGNGFLCAPF